MDRVALACGVSGDTMARIAFVTHEWTLTGAPLVLARTARLLKESGHDILVFGPTEGAELRAMHFQGIETRSIDRVHWLYGGGQSLLGRVIYLPIRMVVNLLVFLELVASFRASRADLVLLNSWASRFAALSSMAAGIPVMWHLHEYPAASGWPAELFRWFVFHTGVYFVFNSQATRSWWLQGRDDPRTRVVYEGIEVGEPIPAERRDIDVLFVGRLSQEKGLDILLSAIRSARNQGVALKAVLAGPLDHGMSVSWLSGRLDEFQGKVEYAGIVTRPRELMRRAKLLVLPTFREGFGRVLIEAMSEGAAVVSTTVGGVPEVVQHGVDGILVAPGDEAALTTTILRLIGDDRARHALTERARETVRVRFSLDRQRAEVLEAFRTALERSGS